jgi:hypothetical protein
MKLRRVGYVDVIIKAYRSGKKYLEQPFYTVILLSRQRTVWNKQSGLTDYFC